MKAGLETIARFCPIRGSPGVPPLGGSMYVDKRVEFLWPHEPKSRIMISHDLQTVEILNAPI